MKKLFISILVLPLFFVVVAYGQTDVPLFQPKILDVRKQIRDTRESIQNEQKEIKGEIKNMREDARNDAKEIKDDIKQERANLIKSGQPIATDTLLKFQEKRDQLRNQIKTNQEKLKADIAQKREQLKTKIEQERKKLQEKLKIIKDDVLLTDEIPNESVDDILGGARCNYFIKN